MTAVTSNEPCQAVSTPIQRRDETIDCLKGALVVFMGLYHALNYTAYLDYGFLWMAFLPPSFIFLTGFLLTSIYARKYRLRDFRLHSRLVTRGLKLLALFTLMNLAVEFLISSHGQDPLGAMSSFFSRWEQVYFAGTGRVAAFEILLPIAYFLILSPFLFLLLSVHRSTVPLLAGAFCAFCWYLESHRVVLENLNLLSAGLVGMAAGMVSLERLKRWAQKWWMVLPLYFGYRALSAWQGESYLIQTLGLVVTLLLLFGLIARFYAPNWFYSSLALLGHYSLLVYIAQIAFLQLYNFEFGRIRDEIRVLVSLALATLLVSYATAWILRLLRQRFPWTNRVYQAAFA